MSYRVLISKNACKQIDRIDRVYQKRIWEFIRDDLSKTDNPRKLSNYKPLIGTDQCRYRIGKYRMICEIHDEEITILIIKLEIRETVYNEI